MLPKSRRLTTKDFKSLGRGRTFHTPHLMVRVFPAPAGREKAAVIVSASTYKKAVSRNLLRRRLYHLVAPQRNALLGRTVTITCKKGACEIPFKMLEEEFLSLLGHITGPTKHTQNTVSPPAP